MAEEIIRLENDQISVAVRPAVGCEIVELVERQSGVNLLWRAPWGIPDQLQQSWSQNSEDFWLKHTSGGWNLLLPHAGAQLAHEGGTLPFHGEAGMARWEMDRQEGASASFRTVLIGSPIAVNRTIRLEGATLCVVDRVTNQSPDSMSISWGHHPTFGEPFIQPGVRVAVKARAVWKDADPATDPSTIVRGRWPELAGADLSVVPPHEMPVALLAYLEDLEEGRYRIINDALGIGVELSWPLELFPHLWLWQELRASPGYPWFRRAYAMALEPQSTVPEGGKPPIRIGGGAVVESEVRATVLRT